MFCFLLGWRKASKCKNVVRQLQCRLKLLKNKRYAISTHLRHDIAQLLRIGERNRALHRAQQLFLDENMMSLYHLLLHFSDYILLHLPCIRRHRELTDGINEAVSTLVFASARCGDLPELRTLRLLLGSVTGNPLWQRLSIFCLAIVSTFRFTDVSHIKEKLSMISVSDDAKSKLLGEIGVEYGLRLEVLALEFEYTPQFHKQVIESGETEEYKEVMGSDLTSAQPCASQDADLEEKQEQGLSKASRAQGIVCQEDDCIEEVVAEKDQRVFRFRENEEDRRERRRSKRRSRSASSSPIAKDVECWRYYYKGRRRSQKKECGQCCHIVYNVFTMWPDQREKGEGERALKEAKHVHPKLPDYDQIAARFTTLRRQQGRHMH